MLVLATILYIKLFFWNLWHVSIHDLLQFFFVYIQITVNYFIIASLSILDSPCNMCYFFHIYPSFILEHLYTFFLNHFSISSIVMWMWFGSFHSEEVVAKKHDIAIKKIIISCFQLKFELFNWKENKMVGSISFEIRNQNQARIEKLLYIFI